MCGEYVCVFARMCVRVCYVSIQVCINLQKHISDMYANFRTNSDRSVIDSMRCSLTPVSAYLSSFAFLPFS